MKEFKVEYSVDKIALKNSVYTEHFKPFMEKFRFNPEVEYYKQTNFKKYKHNFVFENELGSFWLGYRHNQENGGGQAYNAVLEFNPNKVQESKILHEIINGFFYPNSNFTVARCDIAVDLHGIDMKNEVFWDKGGKKTFREFRDGVSKTIYIGKRPNMIKIYDKAQEQGLKDEKWTRYEVSMNVDYTYNGLNDFEYNGALSPIWIIDLFEYDDKLTKTDWCLLQGIVVGAFTVDQLGRGKRKKIRTVLDKQSRFVPDKSQLSRTLRDYVYNSLDDIKSPKKHLVE